MSWSKVFTQQPSRKQPRRRLPAVEELESRALLSTFYVDDSNLPGPGSGTLADPFLRIQDGISAAASGDEVSVAAGTYQENLVMRSGVSVRGAGAAQTTLRGKASTQGVVLFNDAVNATLSGFTITVGAPSPGVDRGVVLRGATDLTTVLERNVITDAELGVLATGPATIRNNTLVGVADRDGIALAGTAGAPVIRNNLITGYTVAGIDLGTASALSPAIDFNDVFGNDANYRGLPDPTGLHGNISTKPLFVGANDFHLQAGSPAIDAGDPGSPPDPDGTTADMGALPFHHAVSLGMPAAPLFVGEFTKVPVTIDSASGLTLADLNFVVPEGAAGGEISLSHDTNFDAAHPDVMLLGGYKPGTYHLQAVNKATNDVVGRGEFTITALDTDDARGPGMWVDGVVPQQFATGSAWGGGPAGPQNVNVLPALGTRRVAVLFVDTAAQRYTTDAAKLQEFKDHWEQEAESGVSAGGKTRSVAHFYREASYNKFDLTFDEYGPVNLPGNWTDYYEQDDNGLWIGKSGFWSAAMAAGDSLIDYSKYDSVLFVSQDAPDGFAWPCSTGGTFSTEEGDKSLAVISMPNRWEDLDPRTIYETLSHEMGHNLGLADLYWPEVPMPGSPGNFRNLGHWDMMAWDGTLPHFSLAHRMMLGWVDPSWLQTFNFQTAGAPIDQTVSLSPIEKGAPASGKKAGIEIRIADGFNYYFEYRTEQADQIGDQTLPTNDRVLGTDVVSPPFVAPILRPPILLLPNDSDGDGSVLGNGKEYHETDFSTPNFPVDFKAAVSGIDGSKADVHITYGINGKPDPSIRPWPASEDNPWQSPDIEVQNPLNLFDPARKNVPWAGHSNDVLATITNGGNLDAPQVTANFYVKDFTVGGAPETLIGSETKDVAAGATVVFSTTWTPPAEGHYCIIVRIPIYQTPTMPSVVEMTEVNNIAQSNYDRFISATASPATREMTSVRVGNPFPKRTQALLVAAQTNPLYRTYVGNRWLELEPGETVNVPVMVEYAYGTAPPADPLLKEFTRRPNNVQVVGLIRDPRGKDPHAFSVFDGVQMQVVTGRKTRFAALGPASARTVTGRIVTVDDGSAVPGGKVLVAVTPADGGKTEYVRAMVQPDGSFVAAVGMGWRSAVAYYLPPTGFGDATSVELESRVVQQGHELRFPVVPPGLDVRPDQLRYTVESGAPRGVKIDPGTGEFSWTPTEAQGPAAYLVTVQMTGRGLPADGLSRSFLIVVTEVDRPPAGTRTDTPLVRDVTGLVTVVRGRVRRRKNGRFRQVVVIQNRSGIDLTGALSMVFDRLGHPAKLFRRSGEYGPSRSPYLDVLPAGGPGLRDGEAVRFVIEWRGVSPPRYTPRVLAGDGIR